MSGSRDILVQGVVFSDLGQAGGFVALDWVQEAVRERAGFRPFPGTLNVRTQGADLARWAEVRRSRSPLALPSPDPAFCSAVLFTGFLQGGDGAAAPREPVAVVVPEVEGYPADKLEILAAVSFKQTWPVRDGERVTVVFDG